MTKILVVDDEPEVCELLQADLSEQSYEVITSSSGKEALKKIKQERPQVMLLDIRMPEMNGIDVLKEAKRRDPALAVIMLTAVHDQEIARAAMAAGAADYVTKPIDLAYLHTSLMVQGYG